MTNDRKNKVYNGEMKYIPIFEFLNVYSRKTISKDNAMI